jgi:hypothetical protein
LWDAHVGWINNIDIDIIIMLICYISL